MPAYIFSGKLRFKLDKYDDMTPIAPEDQADMVLYVEGYPGKLYNHCPFSEGTVSISAFQNGEHFVLQPNSDGIPEWVKEE